VNPWGLIPLISAIAFAILFVLIVQQARRRIDTVFSVFLFASAIWGFTSFMLVFNHNATEEHLIFWNELVIAAIPWVGVSYYHFVRTYNHQKAGLGVYLGYLIVVVNLVLNLSGFVVQSASLENGYLHHDIRNWELVLSAILAPILFASLYLLIKRYRNSTDPVDRNRTMYLIIGWSVLLTFGYITPLTPALAGLTTDHIGNLGNALIIAYAISRFHLLDIKLVFSRSVAYALLSVAIVGAYFLLLYLINGSPQSFSVGVAFFWAFFWEKEVRQVYLFNVLYVAGSLLVDQRLMLRVFL